MQNAWKIAKILRNENWLFSASIIQCLQYLVVSVFTDIKPFWCVSEVCRKSLMTFFCSEIFYFWNFYFFFSMLMSILQKRHFGEDCYLKTLFYLNTKYALAMMYKKVSFCKIFATFHAFFSFSSQNIEKSIFRRYNLYVKFQL